MGGRRLAQQRWYHENEAG